MEGVDKLTLLLNGCPLLAHTASIFTGWRKVQAVIVTVSPGRERELEQLIWQHCPKACSLVRVIAGGSERQESIHFALEHLAQSLEPAPQDLALIHDAARPFIDQAFLERLVSDLGAYDGVIPAVPVRDTIKRVRGEEVICTEDRQTLRLVQTPQVFHFGTIRSMHLRARSDKFLGTDDASLIEHYGGKIRWVPGPVHNLKVTLPEDLALLSYLSTAVEQQS